MSNYYILKADLAAMYEKFISRLSKILFDMSLGPLRLALGVAEFIWALNLLLPLNAFQREEYAVMASLAPDYVWGLVFLLSSILQMTITMTNTSHLVRAKIFYFYNFLLWGFAVFSVFFAIHPPPVALSGDLVLVAAAGWSFIRPILVCLMVEKSIKDTMASRAFKSTKILNR